MRCLDQLVPIEFHARFAPADGVAAAFSRAGHIIGSASVSIVAAGTTINFSGDVGRPVDPIMRPPEPLCSTDYLVVESTYGDCKHQAVNLLDALAEIILDTFEKRVVVPSFAVGRTQHLRGSLRNHQCAAVMRMELARHSIMLPEWNRDLLWSKQDARARRHRSMMMLVTIGLLGLGFGIASQACYELAERADRPAAESVRTISVPVSR